MWRRHDTVDVMTDLVETERITIPTAATAALLSDTRTLSVYSKTRTFDSAEKLRQLKRRRWNGPPASFKGLRALTW
jgi:hypothetical protein